MAIGATLFALMNFFARLATASASWASVGAVRALVGALVAFTVARIRRSSLRANDRRAVFWRSVLGTFSMVSTFYALSSRTLSLGDTVTLLNLAPVFLAVLAPIFLRERTSAGVGLAIAVSLGGVVLVVRPTFLFGASSPVSAALAGSGPSHLATAAIAVCSAFSTSIAMMFLRRVGRTETTESIAFHFSLFAGVVLFLLSLSDLRAPSARDALCMVSSGICAGFAQLAMTRAYAMESAARVSGMNYLTVVVSAVLGVTILGERPGPTAFAGMALVIVGGILLTATRSRRQSA
jgi:drug/metabolite transporter (DMT)-like permease